MSPEEAQELRDRVQTLENMLLMLTKKDRYTIEQLVQVLDGRNFQLGKTTGTQFGTASTQKIGFLGATPASQQGALSSIASGGGDNDGIARTRCDELRDILVTYGFIA